MTLAPQPHDATNRALRPEHGADPRLAALWAYWDARRGARTMPARADLDPADIPRLLANLFLVDVGPTPDDLRWRLAGTEVVRLFGFEVTGRIVGAGMSPNAARLIHARFASVVRKAEPAYGTGLVEGADHRHVPYQRLLLPLSTDGRRVDMLLGMLVGIGYDNLLSAAMSR